MDKQKLYKITREMKQLFEQIDLDKDLDLLDQKMLETRSAIEQLKKDSQLSENQSKSVSKIFSAKNYKVWTDGACSRNPGAGGWAAWISWEDSGIIKNDNISGYDPKTTSNKMEMTAALEALELLPDGCQVHLFSDSQYLKNGIQVWIINWKKKNWKKANGKVVANQDLWKKLDRQNKLKKISWVWIKGHSNIVENEFCDKLARSQIKKNTNT